MKPYLNNCFQFVEDQSQRSTLAEMNAGVAQDSILTYVNDLAPKKIIPDDNYIW